jgi:hypothetical protein
MRDSARIVSSWRTLAPVCLPTGSANTGNGATELKAEEWGTTYGNAYASE